jgi:type VI secretion system protein ImpM
MEITGFHGKLPTHGDFVQRHVAADFALAWDHWLEQALHATQRELGERWAQAYASGPVWRFAFAAGVCGARGCIGVLAPSVDRVGRQFPLAVIRPVAGDPLSFACGDPAWFEAVEHALAAAGRGRYASLDDFDRALQAAPAPAAPALPAVSRCGDLPLPDAHALPVWAGALAHRHLAAAAGQPLSYWWCAGAPAQLRWLTGLPAPAAFGAWLGAPTMAVAPGWNLIPDDPFTPGDEPDTDPADAAGALADKPIVGCTAETLSGADPLALFGDEPGPRGEAAVVPAAAFASAAVSDRGNRRKINQDAFLDMPAAQLWAVADGMGGWSDGDRASRLTIDALAGLAAQGALDERVRGVRKALHDANARLREQAQAPGAAESGSTVVVLLGEHARVAIIWAGDSRVYRLRDGELRQLTRDHSLQQEAAAASADGTINDALPANVITRAIGGDETLELDVRYDDARAGDRYLLCSDGLYRQLEPDELAAMLGDGAPAAVCAALCRSVLQRTADDNLTAVIVDYCG